MIAKDRRKMLARDMKWEHRDAEHRMARMAAKGILNGTGVGGGIEHIRLAAEYTQLERFSWLFKQEEITG